MSFWRTTPPQTKIDAGFPFGTPFPLESLAPPPKKKERKQEDAQSQLSGLPFGIPLATKWGLPKKRTMCFLLCSKFDP